MTRLSMVLCMAVSVAACSATSATDRLVASNTVPTAPTGSIPAPPPGSLALVSVNGQSLPCCAVGTGYQPAKARDANAQVTFVAGNLSLSPTPSVPFVFTPGGLMPADCVHAVPNGSHGYPNGTVVTPDGRTLYFPPCTQLHNASFSMIITYLYTYPAGPASESRSSAYVTDTIAGAYAKSTDIPGDGTLVSLLGTGRIGPMTAMGAGVDVVLQQVNLGNLDQSAPVFEFAGPTR